jgi:hypothetical protein
MEPLKAVKASRVGRRALTLIGIGVVSAGSVAGVSFALTSSSATPAAASVTASTTKSSSARPAGIRLRGLAILRRAVSGELELSTKNGFVTYDFDRGVVTSISASSVTVLRADSQSVTEAVTGTTHMPKRGVPTQGEDVAMISTGGKALYIFDLEPRKSGTSGSSSSSSSSTSGTSAVS